MSNLNVTSVELVTTLRRVPKNGAPSSQEFNDFQQEALADIASIVSLINDQLLPILQALPASAADGLEGRTVLADTEDHTELFFDSVASQSLTVTDVLRKLRSMIQTAETRLTDLGVSLRAVETRLASTNQNDIAQALQDFAASLQQLTIQTNLNSQSISDNSVLINKTQSQRVSTGSILASSSSDVDIDWPQPFASNAYTVFPSLEDASGDLVIAKWVKKASGIGITVTVQNSGLSDQTGTLHAIARAD